MASEEMRDELANNMEQLDVCSSDKAQAVPTPKDPSPSFSEDWLPAALRDKAFTAWPMHMDDNGIIYLYDYNLRPTRVLINRALTKKYWVNFMDPAPEAMSRQWSVGEPCVILYTIYQAYRGRVLSVDKENEKCVVHYIDHAFVNVCSFTKLRKALPLRHIPPHSLRCSLNRIRPIGKTWDEETLNYLRKSIVGKKCFVKVVGDEVDGILPIELRHEYLWVNDYLVNVQRAKYQDSWVIKKQELIIQENTSSDEDEESQTTVPTYPKYYGKEFTCDVVEIHDVHELPVHLIFDDERVFTLYEDMFEEIQQEYMNMPPLDGIVENKPCIARSNEDDQWYRASIEQFNETRGLVKVRYVDHGDTDVIPLDDVREICQKWVNHPPDTLRVKLFGMELNRDKEIGVVANRFADVFLEKFFLRGFLKMKILGYEGTTPLVEITYPNNNWVQAKLVEHDILINRVVSVVRHGSLLKNNFGLTCIKKRNI